MYRNLNLKNIIIAILFSLVTAGVVNSDQSFTIEDMRKELNQQFEKMVCDKSYNICIGLERSKCIVALEKAVNSCPLEEFHSVINEVDSTKTREQKFAEIGEVSNEFTSCTTKAFQEHSGVDFNAHPQCVMPIERANE